MGQNPWPARHEEVLSCAKQTKVAWEYAWAVLKTIKSSNVSCEKNSGTEYLAGSTDNFVNPMKPGVHVRIV